MAIYNINFPKLGQGLELMSMWQKGKKGNTVRFLLGNNGVGQYFVWLDEHFMPGKLELNYADYKDCKTKSPTHVKNKNYNYYLASTQCEQEFDAFIKQFEGSNPLVPETLSSFMHVNFAQVTYKLIEKV